jgi:hypothetical protein
MLPNITMINENNDDDNGDDNVIVRAVVFCVPRGVQEY